MKKKDLVLRILKICFGCFALAGAIIGGYGALTTFINAFNFQDADLAAMLVSSIFSLLLYAAIGFVGVKVIIDLTKKGEPEEKWLPLLLTVVGGCLFLSEFLYIAIGGNWGVAQLWVSVVASFALLAFGILSLIKKESFSLFGFFGFLALVIYYIYMFGIAHNVPSYQDMAAFSFLGIAFLMVVVLLAQRLFFQDNQEAPKEDKEDNEEKEDK